jgi:acetyl esterase/lipase
MNTTLNRRGLGMVAAFALLLAACGSDAAAPATTIAAAPEQTTTPATTTLAPTTTTTTAPTTTTVSSSDYEVTVIKDVAYLEMNGHEYLLDVYVPDGDGPWPVVIALHGAPIYEGNPTNTQIAEAAAEAGMLVFAPNWVAEWPAMYAMDAEFVRSDSPAMPCALAFAQQEAAGYGGDPNRTVVYGYSGGAASGANFVFGPARDLTSGCKAQTPPIAPVGAVLGDAEYFLHASWWNGAFEKDLEEMQTIIAETVDPAFWGPDLPEHVRLWAAADGTCPEFIDDPWDEDGWFAQRDPDGTIRQDLDELGELDDGIISYIDEGLLLATRLQRAGIDATFDIFPGGHLVADKLPEIVAYLLDAAGTD